MAASACGAALCAASSADAAPTRAFDVAPKAYSEALIDLALQADVSLLGASACRGQSRRALRGRYTVDEALRRLLDDAPCAYRMVDSRTVRITAAAAPQPGPPLATAPPKPTPLVAELTVTATKRREAADRLATAITVLPGDQLRLAGAADPTQTTGQIAGVLTTNLGPGRDKILLRGLSDGAFTGRARSTVGSYLDEAAINYNAPDPDLRLVDVERVEVIRGPQGALYGAGALSGVFRIVTRKPDLEAVHAGLASAYAWTDDGAPSQVLEGFGSVPLIRGRLALRATAYREVRGGYLDNLEARRSNVDETVRQGGRASLRWIPAENWTVDLSATAQDLRSNDSQYTLRGSRFFRTNRVAEAHDNRFREAALTVRGPLGWADLTSSTAYVQHDYRSVYDASAAADLYAPASEAALYTEPTRVRLLVQDLVLTSASRGRVGWLAGVYFAASTENISPDLETSQGSGPLARVYAEKRRDRMREAAVYGEASYEIAPRWTIAAGARAFVTRLDVVSVVTPSPTAAARSRDARLTFRDVSPKISIQRDLGAGDLIYALVSEGHRPGGINTAGVFAPRPERASFRPDRLHNIEIGAKLKGFNGRLAAHGALFYESWRDVQSDQFLFPTGLAYTTNVADATVWGLESEVAYDFDFGLSLKSNLLLADADLSHPNTTYARRLIDGLPGAPRVSGGVLAVYQRPAFADVALRLVGDVAYVGRSNLSFDAGLSPRMGDYVRSKLTAQLAGPWWTLEAYVSNPGNDEADTFAYGNPFSLGLVNQATPLRPRTLGVGMTAAF